MIIIIENDRDSDRPRMFGKVGGEDVMTKKMTEKDKAILGQRAPYLLILAVLAGYAIFLCVVKRAYTLQASDFISNITIFMGWIVALLTAAIYLNKTRKDNQKLKKEEIRKSLEIDAFREINGAIINFANVLSEASRDYEWRPFRFQRDWAWDKEHLQKGGLRFHNMKAAMEVDEERQGLMRRLDKFKLTIEAHKIAVIQFDHETKYIKSETDRLDKSIVELRHFMMMKNRDDLFMDQVFSDFKKKCQQIEEKLNEIGKYLGDYRIELMNEFMGPIFERSIPTKRTKNSSPEDTDKQ